MVPHKFLIPDVLLVSQDGLVSRYTHPENEAGEDQEQDVHGKLVWEAVIYRVLVNRAQRNLILQRHLARMPMVNNTFGRCNTQVTLIGCDPALKGSTLCYNFHVGESRG